jgi:hypothetical protein
MLAGFHLIDAKSLNKAVHVVAGIPTPALWLWLSAVLARASGAGANGNANESANESANRSAKGHAKSGLAPAAL